MTRSQEEVRAQLDRILASPLFAQSPRLSSFLRFVVEAQQTERPAARLKEYALGVEVFDRGPDFDPRIDNIVRIQAAKLRSRLVEYYASDGARDPIVIAIPKGSYAPEISYRKPAPPKRKRNTTALLSFRLSI